MGREFYSLNSKGLLFNLPACMLRFYRLPYNCLVSLLLGFTLLGCMGPAIGQDTNQIDSLKQLVSKQSGAEKAENLRMLAFHYSETDITISKQYLFKALNEIDSISEPELWGSIYSNLGIVYTNLQQFDSAEYVLLKAVEGANLAGDSSLLATAFYSLSMLATDQANYPLATTYALNSLRIREARGDSVYMAEGYSLIGNIKIFREAYQEAKSAFLKASAIYQALNLRPYQMTPLVNLGICYKKEGNYDSALLVMNQSREISEELGYPSYLANIYNNLGQVYAELKKLDEAESYYSRSLTQYRQAQDTVKQVKLKSYLGEIKLAKNQIPAAISILQAAADEISLMDVPEDQQSIYGELAKAYKRGGNFQKALEYAEKGEQLRKEILNREKERDIAALETAYETEKKEQRIREQDAKIKREQDRNRILLLSALSIGALLCLVFFLIWNRNRLNQEVKLGKLLTSQQQKRYAAVIEAEEQERKRIAQELHDGLGQLLSTARMNVSGLDETIEQGDDTDQHMFRTSLELIDEACVEVRNVSHNLMPVALVQTGLVPALKALCQKVEASGNIQIAFSADPLSANLGEAQQISVYRILQELINNSLKHAEAEKITLALKDRGHELEISYTDDGKGFQLNSEESTNGIGWLNINSRVEMLNGELKRESKLGEGTRVRLIIPFT